MNGMKIWFVSTVFAATLAAQPVFNVKDYGATGRKQDNARTCLLYTSRCV